MENRAVVPLLYCTLPYLGSYKLSTSVYEVGVECVWLSEDNLWELAPSSLVCAEA